MTGAQRRQQLLDVGREVFARRGYDGASIEELAACAEVSKPVVYEHFGGGKEELYAVVVDREMQRLLDRFTAALAAGGSPRRLLERAALVLLDYIEEDTDGFRVLSRDSPAGSADGHASLIGEVAHRVEHVLGAQLAARGHDPALAGLYSQALVGMVAQVGQWWLARRSPSKAEVAAHLVDLAYAGLAHLQPSAGRRLASGPLTG
jgi:AcrR family transcriptional regulator